MITINEFARRICSANHVRFERQAPILAACPEHMQIARQSWGLIQPNGEKTLAVIMEAALEQGASVVFEQALTSPVPASSRFPAEPATMSRVEIEGIGVVEVPHG